MNSEARDAAQTGNNKTISLSNGAQTPGYNTGGTEIVAWEKAGN